MYFLPSFLPNDWDLAEINEENHQVEFIRIDMGYQLKISYEPTGNPGKPYVIFSAHTQNPNYSGNFKQLNIDSWAETPQEAIEKCIKVMCRINRKFDKRLPFGNH